MSVLRVNGRAFGDDVARVMIGREPTADVVLDHPRVSREHAVVERRGEGWTYRDLGSRNGSFLDGSPVRDVVIEGSVQLSLGDPAGGAMLQLEVDAARVVRSSPPSPIAGADLSSAGRLSAIHEVGGQRWRIGRAPDNDLVLDDLRASRHHAEIRRAAGGFEIVDLQSHNGTFVGSRRISASPLADGDSVVIAGRSFRFVAGRLEEYQDQGAAWLLANNLAVAIDGRFLLQRVAFAVPPARLIALAGPSGAGKTTLLNAVSGRRPADGGTVWYGGQDLYASLDQMTQRIGYVPQSDILHTELTVRRALRFASELRFPRDVSRAEREARVEEVIRDLGLSERADLAIELLSGGQRKRVSVALELLTRPSLLFLDEPTSGLDPANEAQVVNLMRELAAGGRIVMVATHSIETIRRSDLVLFMAPGGHLAYFGRPEDALTYFEAKGAGDGFSGIFRSLADGDGARWGREFEGDPEYDRGVRDPLQRAHLQPRVGSDTPQGQRRQLGSGHQLSVLLRRYVAVLVADRRNLLLLALQAPFFGILIAALAGSDRLNAANAPEATMLAWLLAIAATWLGTSNAIREIVKERPIYERERATGLSIGAYVLSKVIVLSALTLAQVAVLVPIALSLQKTPGGPDSLLDSAASAMLGSTHLELIVGIGLAGLAAMALALLISAAVRRADQVASLLPFLLIAHTILSQPFFAGGNVGLEVAGRASSAYWGVAATASTLDLNRIRSDYELVIGTYRAAGNAPGQEEADPLDQLDQLTVARCPTGEEIDLTVADGDRIRTEGGACARPQWRQDAAIWLSSVSVLVSMVLAFVVGTWFLLRSQDARRGAPRRAPLPLPSPAAGPAPPA